MDMNNENLCVVYCAPELEPFLALSEEDTSGLTFEKEIIYEGSFTKKDANGEIKFSVDEPTMVHWKNTFDQMHGNGVGVPMPLTHTDNPEKNRADVIGMRLGKNAKGKTALYAKTKFVDAEAAKLAKSSDVSIFVSPEHTDGINNRYIKPIRHVAFTNYPVIPGLEKFQAIAASFDPTDITPVALSSALLPVAQQIGIQASEGMDDAQLTQAIVLAFNQLKAQTQNAAAKPGTPQAPQVGPFGAQKPGVGMSNVPAAFTKMLKENRETKLDALVLSGNITKATRDKLALAYCSPEQIGLALSSDETGDKSNALFDSMLDAMKDNKAVEYDERTGHQIPGALRLANKMNTEEENALLKNANRRAKENVSNN